MPLAIMPKKSHPVTFRITASCGCGWKCISTNEQPENVITKGMAHSLSCRHTLDVTGIIRKPKEPKSYISELQYSQNLRS